MNKRKILPEKITDFVVPLFVYERQNIKSVFVVEQNEFDSASDNKYVACKKLDYKEEANTIIYSAENTPRIIKYKRELQPLLLPLKE